ncbi:hypothetical protein CPB97_011364 [Podila verticillata]|nr:hypothetical protein CPB97_011364 [Podila verticillata]
MIHGTLLRLEVPKPFLDYLAAVHYIMDYSPQLENLLLPAQDNTILSDISFLSQNYRFADSRGLPVTFVQYSSKTEKILAKVNLQRWYPNFNAFIPSQGSVTPDADGSFASVDFQFWEHDYISERLVDTSADLLEGVSRMFPFALKSFDLDVSALSKRGLRCVKEIFRRSTLEQLLIRCVHIDPGVRKSIGRVLGAVRWLTIKSLVLLGDNIDEWFGLWTEERSSILSNTSGMGPSQSNDCLILRRLIIKSTGSTDNPLSHVSALAIHRLIYMSPQLVELSLTDVALMSDWEWDLMIDALDFAVLEHLSLPHRDAPIRHQLGL